jgi:hypothetical protein
MPEDAIDQLRRSAAGDDREGRGYGIGLAILLGAMLLIGFLIGLGAAS